MEQGCISLSVEWYKRRWGSILVGKGDIYHHSYAAASKKDAPRKLLSVFIGDFGFQLDETNASTSEEVH